MLLRIHYIDLMIREGRYPNVPLLARQYETDKRTIERDIEYMRYQLGCPIEYDRRRRGYCYTEPTFALPAVAISESELFALCVAEKAMEHYRATPLYEPLSAAFQKILSVLPDEVNAGYSWLNPSVTFLEQSQTRIRPEIWETVSRAMYSTREIYISYRKPGADAYKQRTVRPYHMVSYGGEWYLAAYCCNRGQVLLFAVSRIGEAEITEKTFERPADFSITDYLGSHFGITRENAVHKVIVEFEPEAAPFIKERLWHDEQKLIELPNGRVRLSFSVSSLIEVKRWILSWGNKAEAIEPEILRHEIREEMETTLSKYK